MKNCLLILLCLFSFAAFGQKYKLKKDILQKDKVPVAKVEGKVNLSQAALTLTTMDGTPTLLVSNGRYKSDIPGTAPLSWYNFYFPQLDKTIMLKVTNNYFNTKQFLRYEFEKKEIHFYEDGLHEEELAKLEDYSQQLHADTLELLDFISFYKDNLAANHIKRDPTEPLTFGTFTQSSDIAIIQGKDGNGDPLVIGKISYTHNPGASISDPAKQHRVKIFKKLSAPIEQDGRQTDYLIAGYIDLFESFPELFLYQEGRNLNRTEYAVNQQSEKNTKAAKDAAAFMVKNGYL